jgi:GLPGLI family protein
MKQIMLILFAVVISTPIFSQQTPERLIVKSKTEITFPDNPNRGAGGDGDGFGSGPSGMETKSTVYFKTDFIKTQTQTDFGNNTVIIDKKNKKTTTLTEAMGRKTGFYTTEADQEKMRENAQKRMDSMRAAGGENAERQRNFQQSPPEIEYPNETKKIAGYTCKKAIIKTKNRQGEISEVSVWFAPDIKKPEGYPLAGNNAGAGGRGGFAMAFRGPGGGGPGGGNGGGGRNTGFGGGGFGGVAGLDKIDGFIMGYSMSRPNGFKMEMQVTAIEVNPNIDDKVFDIPKGYDIKPASEMQQSLNRVQVQIGGPPPPAQ